MPGGMCRSWPAHWAVLCGRESQSTREEGRPERRKGGRGRRELTRAGLAPGM